MAKSGRVNESGGQKIRAGDLQRRGPRLHARRRNAKRKRSEQKSARRRLGALEEVAQTTAVKPVGTARCAVRTPQRGVPTMKAPFRKRLPHDIPLSVDPSKRTTL